MVDITTLSIVLVLLGAFCAPFIYAHHKKSKQEKQLVSLFLAKATDHQLHIHALELWGRTYVIGLDKDLLQILYIKFYPEIKVQIVDLKKIKNVSIIDEHRLVGPDREKIIDNLWLLFIPEDQNLPDMYLEFYNAREKFGLYGEPLIVKKWQKFLEITLNDFQKRSSDKKNATGLQPSPV